MHLVRVVGLFVLSAAIVPVLITGMYRVAPTLPTIAPFVGVVLLAGILSRGEQLRAAAAGLTVGALAHGVLLAWLFATMGRDLERLG